MANGHPLKKAVGFSRLHGLHDHYCINHLSLKLNTFPGLHDLLYRMEYSMISFRFKFIIIIFIKQG